MAEKDWKAEYYKQVAVVSELQKVISRYQCLEDERYYRAKETQDKFKELLIDVLGK